MNNKKGDFMKKTMMVILTLFVLAVLAGCAEPKPETATDSLGACLAEKGIKMYGTDWCGACQAQKSLLGDDFKNVDFVNCDESRSECTANEIQYYPTWIIDGEKHVGVQDLGKLAGLAGCTEA
jgi:glutaredoxin